MKKKEIEKELQALRVYSESLDMKLSEIKTRFAEGQVGVNRVISEILEYFGLELKCKKVDERFYYLEKKKETKK